MKSYLVFGLVAVLLSSVEACSTKNAATVPEFDLENRVPITMTSPQDLDAALRMFRVLLPGVRQR